ncbi:hypothetical protein [Segnochrobactrum spirostomi]|nr:hypothetical protein [Segnochrobactrum spirostomi]
MRANDLLGVTIASALVAAICLSLAAGAAATWHPRPTAPFTLSAADRT